MTAYHLGDWSQHPARRALTPMAALDACSCGRAHDQSASCEAVRRAAKDGANRERVMLKLFGKVL